MNNEHGSHVPYLPLNCLPDRSRSQSEEDAEEGAKEDAEEAGRPAMAVQLMDNWIPGHFPIGIDGFYN